MSGPIPKLVSPAATAAAAPPEDPPGGQAGSQGLLGGPKSGLKDWGSPDQRGRVGWPTTMAPARRNDATTGASTVGTCSASSVAPPVERRPAVARASLIVTGRPCSGGSGPPATV